MNDTPGWASPGSAPSDRPGQGPEDRGEQGNAPAADPGWSQEQPPPAPWPAPGSQPPSGRQPPQPGPQGWGTPPPPPGGNWGGPGGPGGSGGPGGPGGGWGGQPGGWGGPGNGWGGPPPAAKPGVVPLRPMGVGEILDGAVSTMRAHWRTVFGISLTVAAFTQLLSVLIQGLFLDDVRSDALSDPSASLSEISDTLGSTLLASSVVQIIALLGTIAATALLTMIISRAVIGRTATIAEAWRDARPQLLRLLGVTLLVPLILVAVVVVCMVPGILVDVLGGGDVGAALAVFGMLGGFVLAIWLYVKFVLASPALMLEKQGVIASMRRSAKLVRGAWWRVFGIELLTLLIMVIIQSIIAIPFSVIAATVGGDGLADFVTGGGSDFGWSFLVISAVGSVIASTLTLPISAGVTVLLYIDQRIRREALDIELTAAAARNPGRPDAMPGS